MIRSRRVKLIGHVASKGKKRNACRVLVGKPEERGPLGRPRCRLGIVLRWILEKLDGMIWTGFIWLRIGTSGKLL
jgi:hypothetical protein